MRFAIFALWIALISAASAVQVRVASFNIGAHFATTYFDYGLGAAGTPDHDSVQAILGRINADVVALEEIHSVDLQGSPDDLDDLAAALGYPYLHEPPVTGCFDTSLRVVILSRFPFITAQDIGSPAGTKELTRLHPVVKIDVPGTSRDLVMLATHLKAGTETADRFRRAVEMKRLTGYLTSSGLTNDDNYIVLGDFNPSSKNTSFAALPAGLPTTFVLGSDIMFPVNYSTNPLTYFATPSAVKLDPRQLDGSVSTYGTTAPGGPTLDLLLVSPAIAGRPVATEVYNSALDLSNATGLAKTGPPLAAATSAAASDHYAVFADLELDADFPNLDLTFSAPAVAEGSADGTVMVNVTLPAVKTGDLTVTVSSDDPAAALPVSAPLVIPAGSLTASAAVHTSRNFTADGQRSVTFTATATGYDPDSAVLQVDDADGPYVFTAPGRTVVENFSGFAGDHDPAPWVSGGALVWQGIDDGSSAVAGLRGYGSAADPSLGFLPQGAGTTATAGFVNQSPVPLTALRITLDAEQWRAATNGSADGISADLLIAGQAVPLPGLSFTASSTLPDGAVPGGAATALTATASGLSIPPGASFDLRVSFNPGPAGGVAPGDVFVNEFHYDNSGTDAGEFVEIVVGPGYAGALSDISVILYNGADGKFYGTHKLDTFTLGATTASGHRIFSKAIADIQNGAPDGIAVVSGAAVLHFISYEGTMTATNGPAAGMLSTDIGVSQGGGDPVGLAALGLTGTGGTAADFIWKKSTGIAHSPGQPNDAQVFALPVPPPQGLAIDNISITFLTDTDQDGLPDLDDPDDDNDGQPDASETAFGSDPLDAGSRFLPTIARSAAAPSGLELSFPGAPGIQYTVESSADLTIWQEFSTHTGTGQAIVVPLPASGPQMFFRVRAGE